MPKLQSFEEFSRFKAEQVEAENLARQEQVREESAKSFKDLLSEFGVSSVTELSEEDRPKFNKRLGTLTESALLLEGTRSQVGKIDKNGKITSVYVHYDGYPDHMVPTIKNYDKKGVDQLIKLGASGISFLDKKIGKKQDFNKPEKGTTLFYGRDRGENNDMTTTWKNAADVKGYFNQVANDSGAEYVYLYDERDGKWYMGDTYGSPNLKVVESVQINEAAKLVTDFAAQFESKDVLEARIAEGNEFGAARAKAIADGKDEFEVDGKKYPVTKVDKDDKENAEEFAGESVVTEAMFKAKDLKKPAVIWWYDRTGKKAQVSKVEKAEDLRFPGFGDAPSKEFDFGFNMGTLDRWIQISGEKDPKVGEVYAVKESVLSENYEVIYSDGVSAMKKFRTEGQALDFMRDTISSNKKLRDIAVYKPGMHSTTETDKVVAFWGNGSYLDNVSKKDPKLAAKKVEESATNEAEVKSADEFKEYAFTVLQKAFGEDFDEAKAQEVVDGILAKADGDYGTAVGMLQSSLG